MKLNRLSILLFACYCFLCPTVMLFAAPPDEGMWLMNLVNKYNYENMRFMGCKLSAEQIYSESQPSLKDAVVSLGDFCTAEFVSGEGLLFTNHHCGYDAIAAHSTVENNLLANGFWASTHADELTNPGLFVKQLVRMQEVTDSILPYLEGLTENERINKVRELSGAIASHASFSGKYKVDVKPFFYGNQYFLFVYRVFNDVRLVAAPPASIGNFGGDTDNWMWPRHTGDFSVFRVYADKDNNPTSGYSPDNVPYHPVNYLPVSMKGINNGDYQMVIGYPGNTNRYIPSFAISNVILKKNPALVKIISAITEPMQEDMASDPAVKLALAPDFASLMNSQKLYESQITGLKKMHLVEWKEQEEASFLQWAKLQGADSVNQYTQAFNDMRLKYELLNKVEAPFYYAFFNVVYSQVGSFAMDINDIEGTFAKDTKPDDRQKIYDNVKASATEFFNAFIFGTQQKVLLSSMELYCREQPGEELPQPLQDILKQYKGNTANEKLTAFVKEAYDHSILTSKERFDQFMSKPSMKSLKKDALYNYYVGLYAHCITYRQQLMQANRDISNDMRIYLKGMMAMQPGTDFYPDANFTMRLSYGLVSGYEPRDAVRYDWMTTLSGVMEKEDSTVSEFTVPKKLKELYDRKDFGKYDYNGDVPVCFLTTNDITGGNSGSPVINANGELTGLAFDGDYEGAAGDYKINPDLNRTICVDIRYILFIMDKFAHADNLMNEMKIVY